MKRILIIGIILCILFISGCTGTNSNTTSDMDISKVTEEALNSCEEQFIMSETGCCPDKNNDNICDSDEEIKLTENTKTNEEMVSENNNADNTNKPKEETDEQENIQDYNTALKTLIKYLAKTDVSFEGSTDYLDIFMDEYTTINFNEETSAKMVTASLKLQFYLGNPDKLSFSFLGNLESFDENKIDELFQNNLIIMGNSCNNDFIKEFLAETDEECNSGMQKGKGILKLYKLDGNYVLLIIGYDDEDVYSLVKKMINNELSYSGQELEVNLE